MTRAAALLAFPLALALAACTSGETAGPTPPMPEPVPDGPRAASEPDRPWQWFLDASFDASPGAGGTVVRDALHADVVSGAPRAGRERTYVLVEGEPTPVSVGEVVWPRDAWAGAGAATAGWGGTVVHVDWNLCVRRKTTCTVEVEAVPSGVASSGGGSVTFDEYRVHRVLALDEALVLWVDPSGPRADVARALVGSPGPAGRLVLRVRG